MPIATLLLAQQQQADPWQALVSVLWIPAIFLLFWLFILRPQVKRQEAERRALQESLEKGDRVLVFGGIYGIIANISDKEDEVTVKLDENARMKVTRGAISRNLTKEEQLRQPAEPAKEEKK